MHVVLCNCPPADAARIATTLVEERLAACINAVPGVRSFYLWEGRLCDEVETTLILKTATVDRLRARLVELHPYEVPEVLALQVDEAASHPAYVAWVHGTLPA